MYQPLYSIMSEPYCKNKVIYCYYEDNWYEIRFSDAHCLQKAHLTNHISVIIQFLFGSDFSRHTEARHGASLTCMETNFPADFNCDGKDLREMGVSLYCQKACYKETCIERSLYFVVSKDKWCLTTGREVMTCLKTDKSCVLLVRHSGRITYLYCIKSNAIFYAWMCYL